jgi:putative PEP-CTERM system TPR-repeat lipoprotein
MANVKTALEREPDNVAGRALLARISFDVGDVAAAEKELNRALAAGANPKELRDLHYQILVAQDDLDKYKQMATELATETALPEARRASLLGLALYALGDDEEAAKSFDAALKASPDDPAVLKLHARALTARRSYDEAIAKLRHVTEAHPDDAEAWFLLGTTLRRANKVGEARDALERSNAAGAARDLRRPERLLLLATLADAQLDLRDTAKAEKTLGELASFAPGNPATLYLKGRLDYVKGDYRAAAADLQRALQKSPYHAPTRLMLGATYIAQGATEQAVAELGRLVADDPANLDARKMLVQAYLAANDLANARKVLDDIDPNITSDPQLDWLRGTVMLRSGAAEDGLESLRRSAAANPQDAQKQVALAAAYLSLGNRDGALKILESLAPGAGGEQATAMLLAAKAAGLPKDQAQREIDKLLAERGDDPVMLAVAGSFFARVGDADKGRELLTRAIAADPSNANARLDLARLDLRSRQYDSAQEQFKAVLDIDAQNQPAQIGLAELALAQGDRAQAREILEKAVGNAPEAVEARLRLASLSFADGDATRAQALIDQAEIVSERKPEVLNASGVILLSAGRTQDALSRFRDALRAGLPEAGLNAAKMQLDMKQEGDARLSLQEALRLRPNWLPAVATLADLDARAGKIDQALERAKAMRAAGGDAAVRADELTGDINLKGKRYDAAEAAYLSARNLEPSSRLTVKLFETRRQAGKAHPENTLKEALETTPNDVTVRLALANYYQAQGDNAAAVPEYERSIALQPNNPFALNNLAWIYYEAKDERALPTARRAYDLAPAEPTVADTYGWILVEQGRAKEGLPILEKAAANAGDIGEIQYHHAVALARAGQNEKAAATLRGLLDSKAQFPSSDKAHDLLRSLTTS